MTLKKVIRKWKEKFWNWFYAGRVKVVWPEEEVQLEIRERAVEYHDHALDEEEVSTEVKTVTRREAELEYDATPCLDTDYCYGVRTQKGRRIARVRPKIED